MKIERLVLGAIQENCYIVHLDEGCVIVDPGTTDVLQYCLEKQLKVTDILLTHGHYDHIGGVDALVKEYGAHVYATRDTMHVVKDEVLNLSFRHQPITLKSPIHDVGDGIHIGSEIIDVYETPGHVIGSCCYLFEKEKIMFTGDTLFAGSIGRVDFPGSSMQEMQQSITLLKNLQIDCVVAPGHGETTTLEEEKANNPYFQ